jgi:prepilin-type N-terminal cleavage/methylation domain-containing protein
MTGANGKVKSPRGFSLLEILMCLGLITLLIAISYPGYKRSGLRERAGQLKEDLVVLDAALQSASKDFAAPAGVAVGFDSLRKYLKKGSRLEKTGLDPFGNAYEGLSLGGKPSVPEKSASLLSDIVDAEFWAPYAAAK